MRTLEIWNYVMVSLVEIAQEVWGSQRGQSNLPGEVQECLDLDVVASK